MEDKLQSITTILAPVLIAYFVASNLGNKKIEQTKRNELAGALETVASILLPLVILGIVRHTEISGSLWWTLMIGFMLPILMFVIASLASRVKYFAETVGHDRERSIREMLLASFGGGNRGNLLILTAFGSQIGSQLGVSQHFVVLDLGNLLCLLFLGFAYVNRLTAYRAEYNLSEVLESLFKHPGFYIVLLILLQLPLLRDSKLGLAVSEFETLFKVAGPTLSLLFSFLVFLSIFLRIETVSKVIFGGGKVFMLFFIVRICGLALVVSALVWFSMGISTILATMVLCLMPPSSFLWAKTKDVNMKNAAGQCPQGREQVYIIPNFFYFVLLFMAILWGVIGQTLLSRF